jgi:hypothetical protein
VNPFHERLARVALEVTASYGFALAGGYAVQAHGFLDRPSADVDLFAEASAQFDFTEAVDVVIAAYQRDGLEARAEARSSSFARLSVSSTDEQARVELGVDWRKNEPIRLAIGPVLHADDAVANKVCALFGRAEVRDYVDVAAILASGRGTPKRSSSALPPSTITRRLPAGRLQSLHRPGRPHQARTFLCPAKIS